MRKMVENCHLSWRSIQEQEQVTSERAPELQQQPLLVEPMQ
jgi:hypothetical protein